MKISDITTTDPLVTEAPAGFWKQTGRKLGSKVLGFLGAKGAAAGLKGAEETGAEANELMVKFRYYLARRGKKLSAVTGPEVAAWLKKQGYPTEHLQKFDKLKRLSRKQLDRAFLNSVEQAVDIDRDDTVPQNRSDSQEPKTATGQAAPVDQARAGGTSEPAQRNVTDRTPGGTYADEPEQRFSRTGRSRAVSQEPADQVSATPSRKQASSSGQAPAAPAQASSTKQAPAQASSSGQAPAAPAQASSSGQAPAAQASSSGQAPAAPAGAAQKIPEEIFKMISSLSKDEKQTLHDKLSEIKRGAATSQVTQPAQ